MIFDIVRPATFLIPSLLLACPAAAQGDLTRVFPNGARQGSKVTLTFGGEGIPDTASLLVDGEGIKPVGPFTKGVGEVEIAADARPGVRHLRLAGPKGGTTPRPFAVGAFPELNEKEPDNFAAQAQQIERLPVVLNGTLPARPDVDTYRVSLKKGECLVVAGESRALGAPTNLLVRIRDAVEGRELLVRSDYRTRDPLFGFVAPSDADYLVELQDVMNNYSNIDNAYVYRVTLTTGPWIDAVFPPGARRGASSRLTFSGWNLGGQKGPSNLDADVSIPADAPRRHAVSAGGAPNAAPIVTFPGAWATAADRKPGEEAGPVSVTAPVAIAGTFGAPGERDAYRFTARASQPLMLDVDARDLGSFADPVLIVADEAGKVLNTVDDEGGRREGSRDPRLLWAPPADGTYVVRIRDVAAGTRGGPAFFYHLSIAPPEPEVQLTTQNVTLSLKPGASLEVPVSVIQSYQPAELTLRAEGLPPGITATPVTVPASPEKTGTTQVKLKLTAEAGLAPGGFLLRVVVTAGDPPVPLAAARATWVLSKDRSGTLATGSAERLMVVVPAP